MSARGPAIRACRWAWPTSPRCCGTNSCATAPATRNGPIATAFVLSNGHGSMLLYSLLHLSGYDLPVGELERFRQLHSKTPGHPEHGSRPASRPPRARSAGPRQRRRHGARGATARESLQSRLARGGRPPHLRVRRRRLPEWRGSPTRCAPLAGTLGLGKLVAVYDDNGISIDGEVDGWFHRRHARSVRGLRLGTWCATWTATTPTRYGPRSWPRAPRRGRPSLLCCNTIIGWGSPAKQGKASSHGAPLGADEVARVREAIGWPHPPFEVPAAIYSGWDARARGAQLESAWNQRFEAYRAEHPGDAAEFERRMRGELPAGWDAHCDAFIAAVAEGGADVASRKASQNTLDGLGPALPELVGGSADLTGSNLTRWSGCVDVTARGGGNYIGWFPGSRRLSSWPCQCQLEKRGVL